MDAGDVVALARAEGRPLVVSLWASWCAPCVAELPALDAFQRAHPEALVLGLTTDDPDLPADAARLRKILSDRRPPAFALGRLAPGGEGAFLAAFGRRWDGMLPKLLVLDRGGALVLALDGEVGDRLAREVAPALRGAP